MKRIVKRIVSWIMPVLIILCLFGIFTHFRYQEKPTVQETQVIEKFFGTHKK